MPLARRSPGSTALVLVLALAGAALAPAPVGAALPPFCETTEWSEARTADFVVLSAAGRQAARDVAIRLERLARVMAMSSPGFGGTSPTRTRVLLLNDVGQVRAYARSAEMENAVGFSTGDPVGEWVVLASSSDGLLGRNETLAHEYAHVHLRANFASLPTWLNEGFAQYVSTVRLQDTRAELGRIDRELLEFFAGQKPMTMTELFAITTQARAYLRDNELQRAFYVQSWLLTHYLVSESGGRRERLSDWLTRLRRGEPARNSFIAAFGDHDYDLLHAETAAHRERIPFEPLRRIDLPARFGAIEVSERTVPTAEVLTRLGALALALGRDRGAWAREHFERAIALDPQSALAHAGLGFARDLQGDAAAADSAYARAAALAPTAAGPALWAGLGTMLRFQPEGPVRVGATPPVLLAARRHLARAVPASADDPEALAAYGHTFVLDAQPDSSALRALERALELRPGRSDVATDLASLRERTGDRVGADRALEQHAATNVVPGAERGVRDGTDAVRIEQARALVEQGRFDTADSLLRWVERETPEEPSRMQARQALNELRERRGDHAFVELFERGRMHAAAGRFTEARLAFEQARDTVTASEPRLEAGRAIVGMRVRERLTEAQRAIEKQRLGEAARTIEEALALPLGDEDRAMAEGMQRDVAGMREMERALGLAKAGRLREARGIFAAVAASEVSESIRSYARTRVADLDAMLKPGR